MERFDEMLLELKDLNLIQANSDWEEDLYQTPLWTEYFDTEDYGVAFDRIAQDLDIDKHRWYETSIGVVRMYGRLLGIRHISNIYVEGTDCSDMCNKYYFFEMEQVPSVTYKEIK